MHLTTNLLVAGVSIVGGLWGLRTWTRTRHERRVSAAAVAEAVQGAAAALTGYARSEYFPIHLLRQFERQFESVLAQPLPAPALSLLPAQTRSEYQIAWNALSGRSAFRDAYNGHFVRARAAEVAPWFRDACATILTAGQLDAIVTDEDSTLVVAAAGSGKTTTIVAKIQYLVARGLARPGEICVLAFNRDAARTVQERLESRGIHGVRATTFHAMGYAITGEAIGAKPPVSPLVQEGELPRFLMDLWRRLILATEGYRELLILWFTQMRVTLDMLTGGTSPHDTIQLEHALDLRTLTDVKVKSQSEVKVADWLTHHGIDWEYERPYELEERETSRRRYQPDFFLPESNAWVEVRGLYRDGSGGGGIDPVTYRTQMDWKRSQHARNGTTLIEIFQDDIWASDFQKRTRELLTRHGVAVRELSNAELSELLTQRRGPAASRLAELIRTFLSLHRGGGLNLSELMARVRDDRDRSFLQIYTPVYQAYEAALVGRGEIDFDSMLGGSIAHLANTTSFRSRYLFVDEFQDTSRSRLALARGLRDSVDGARLFLVGDDWQSINRFAGSDLGLFVDAPEHIGPVARVDLDVTFRLPADVLRISSAFITQNPRQLKKTLSPFRPKSAGRNLVLVPHATTGLCDALEKVLSRIADDAGARPHVLVLARYNRDINDPAVRSTLDRYKKSGFEIETRTVHRAKGLEASHVVVIGLSSVSPGFPSTVLDDPVLHLVSSAPDAYPFAEERRLMYVALTRSLGRTYLLFPEETPSLFVDELRNGNDTDLEIFGELAQRLTCPRCRGHTVRRRDGKYGAFWACQNFPQCEGRIPSCQQCKEGAMVALDTRTYRCTACGSETERCLRCADGELVKRQGSRGAFWGCTNWRADGSGCGYTRNV